MKGIKTLVMRLGPFVAATSLAIAIVILASAADARGAEIRILSAAAMQSVFKEIAGDFERVSGHRLIISYDTIGGVTQRIRGGEPTDVVIGSTLSGAALIKDGKVDAGSQVTICKAGVGVVVPSGTPKPPITSVDDFKAALLSAKAVVYADPARGGAAGVHVARVIQALGIAAQLQPRTVLAAGGDVTEVTLAQGAGALGMTQLSEIVQKTGAEFVGPLPEQLQNYTVFTAATLIGARPSEAVREFIKFLKSPVAAAAMKAKGMQSE